MGDRMAIAAARTWQVWLGRAAGSILAGAILFSATSSARAYFRPMIVAAPRPITMPTFRPVVRPMIMPMPHPVVRFAPRPNFNPIIRPIARPLVQPNYRPPALPAPRVAQPIMPQLRYPTQPVSVTPPDTSYRPPVTVPTPALKAPQPQQPNVVTTIIPGAAATSQKPAVTANMPAPAPTVSTAPSGSKPTQQQPSAVTTIIPGAAATSQKPAATTNMPAVTAPGSTTTAILKPVAPVQSAQPTMVTTNSASTPATAQKTTATANLGTAAITTVNAMNQVLQSKPGQILTSSLSAAGGAAAPGLSLLGQAAEGANIANAYLTAPNKTSGLLAAGSELSGDVAVDAAGMAGGPLAAGATQALVTAGNLYVAPALGNAIYNAAPGLFTPASSATVNVNAAPYGVLTAPVGQLPLTAQQMNSLLSLN